jgi:hypothetical protein
MSFIGAGQPTKKGRHRSQFWSGRDFGFDRGAQKGVGHPPILINWGLKRLHQTTWRIKRIRDSQSLKKRIAIAEYILERRYGEYEWLQDNDMQRQYRSDYSSRDRPVGK